MPRGISINIGLNRVDPMQYGSQFKTLRGCEHDARDMFDIARSRGFDAELILADEATSYRVIDAIGGAAQTLTAGDILLLTFAGHGSQVLDDFHGDDEDGFDETLVLFDRNLIDDELYSLWGRFRAGVRVLFICDSCHSGTPAQLALSDSPPAGEDEGFFNTRPVEPDECGRPRLLRSVSPAEQARHLAHFRGVYDAIRGGLTDSSSAAVAASVIQLGACQDHQEAADGERNGLFTGKLRQVWNEGAFEGDYRRFLSDIQGLLPAHQQPRFLTVGAPDGAFEAQRPFTI